MPGDGRPGPALDRVPGRPGPPTPRRDRAGRCTGSSCRTGKTSWSGRPPPRPSTGSGTGLGNFFRSMWPAPAWPSALAALVAVGPALGAAGAAPVLAAWFLSPLVAYWVSRPRRAVESPLTDSERAELRRIARKTWHFFETFVGDEDHWLPPDNYQEDSIGSGGRVAHRTSPTNKGMLLLSTLAAHDFGYLGLRRPCSTAWKRPSTPSTGSRSTKGTSTTGTTPRPSGPCPRTTSRRSTAATCSAAWSRSSKGCARRPESHPRPQRPLDGPARYPGRARSRMSGSRPAGQGGSKEYKAFDDRGPDARRGVLAKPSSPLKPTSDSWDDPDRPAIELDGGRPGRHGSGPWIGRDARRTSWSDGKAYARRFSKACPRARGPKLASLAPWVVRLRRRRGFRALAVARRRSEALRPAGGPGKRSGIALAAPG